MKRNNISKNLICLLIIIAVITVLYLLAPKTIYAPKGILLPAKNQQPVTLPTNIDHMRIYASNALLFNYETVGTINVMLHSTETNPSEINEDKIVQYALNLAANYGANAIIIKQLYYVSPKMINKNLAAYQLKATAIIVNKGFSYVH